jgi:TRAP-type C4-dicarboxylate transport system substrate-binding protein
MRLVHSMVAILLVAGTARADGVLRIGTIAPDGTAWAHVGQDFARDVEHETEGSLKVKWYFGGVAGDDVAMLERIKRGQLDGAAMTIGCDRIAPSLKVSHVLGLIQTRPENSWVLGHLRTQLEEEFQHSGFVPLVMAGFGETILFTRQPIRSMQELRSHKLWVWKEEPVLAEQLTRMGLKIERLGLEEAASAYDERRIDGWFVIPTAALAFQLATRARYFVDLRSTFLDGCMVVSERSFFKLSAAQQQAVKHASDRLARSLEVVGEKQEDQLLGGLLQKQGVQPLDFSGAFRAEFFADARRARDAIAAQLVPEALLAKVQALIADFRAEHAQP